MLIKLFQKYSNIRQIQDIINSATIKQSAVTFSGTFINGALGAIFYIFSARYLGPASFGLMILAITALTMISDISDLGTGTGIVRFVSEYLIKDRYKAYRFLKLGLKVKIIVSIVVVILGWISSPLIAEMLFSKAELTTSLRIAFIGVSSALLFTFITSTLQSLQKFWSWSIIQIGTNSLRLIFVFALTWIGILNLNLNLLVYIFIPLVGFIVGMMIIKPDFMKVKNEYSVAKEFFHYNKWVALFSLVAALGARMDIFISGRLLTNHELGIYSASNQLVQVIPQFVVAIHTVIAPKMASMDSFKEFMSYLKKTQVMVLGIAILIILLLPIAVYLIPLLYGNSYITSVPVFIVLLVGMLFFLISTPIHISVFYYFSNPRLFFWLSCMHLIIVSVASWIFVSSYGAMGGAIAVLLGQIVSFIIPLIWITMKIKSKRISEE